MNPTTQRVLHGVRFDVDAITLPGGHRKEIVVHPGAVAILPLLDRDHAVLIRNERIAVGKTLWEIPAGTLEKGEDPAACAARELIEETGYSAATIRPLAAFFTSPGICTERMWTYCATGLTHVGQDLDATEKITVEAVPLDRVMKMIQSGEIEDGKTIATVLYYHTFAKEGER